MATPDNTDIPTDQKRSNNWDNGRPIGVEQSESGRKTHPEGYEEVREEAEGIYQTWCCGDAEKRAVAPLHSSEDDHVAHCGID